MSNIKYDPTKFKVDKLQTKNGEVDVVRRIHPCLDLEELLMHFQPFCVGQTKGYKVKICLSNMMGIYDFTGDIMIDPVKKEFRLIVEE